MTTEGSPVAVQSKKEADVSPDPLQNDQEGKQVEEQNSNLEQEQEQDLGEGVGRV